jgi:hypothetical protein
MARFTRLAAQQALELGQKETNTSSTCPSNARARPGARPHAPTPRDARPYARAYKTDQGLDRMPSLALSPAQAQDRRSSIYARRASGCPSPDHCGPATLAHLDPVQSLAKPPRSSVKLSSPQTEHHIAGGSRLTSPDFIRPSSHVDRAAR